MRQDAPHPPLFLFADATKLRIPPSRFYLLTPRIRADKIWVILATEMPKNNKNEKLMFHN
jgi:hypothetical protein